jgi:hypothetical protein
MTELRSKNWLVRENIFTARNYGGIWLIARLNFEKNKKNGMFHKHVKAVTTFF